MFLNSAQFTRYFREILGDFFSAEMIEAKRFVLSVADNGMGQPVDVPIFVRRKDKAQYPEIRMTPFFADPTLFPPKPNYSYSPGIPPMENPDIMYKRERVDSQVRRSQVQVDIYALDKMELYQIRDALIRRMHQFLYVEVAPFIIPEGWVEDANGVYSNSGYDTTFNIIQAYEGNYNYLTKTADVETTVGSWNLTDEGLFVNPFNEISDVIFLDNTNEGKVFSDGSNIRQKGILIIKTIRSHAISDPNPLIERWSFMFRVDFIEEIPMGVGRTFKEVDVNGNNQ